MPHGYAPLWQKRAKEVRFCPKKRLTLSLLWVLMLVRFCASPGRGRCPELSVSDRGKSVKAIRRVGRTVERSERKRVRSSEKGVLGK
jgi:hypothetical protein